MNQLARQALTIVYPVNITHNPDWEPGPLPLVNGSVCADADTRRTYHAPNIARVLYGPQEQPARWHRWLSFEADTVAGIGIELLLGRDYSEHGWAILHLRGIGESPEGILRSVAERRHAPPPPFNLENLTDGYARRTPHGRPFSLAMVTPTRNQLPALYPRKRYRKWHSNDQWLWTLASRSTLDDHPPDPESRDELLEPLLRFSADWRALVLRDGAAFVATRPDHGDEDDFFPFAELYMRTVYLDSLLLGLLQERAITGIEKQLGDVFDSSKPHKLMGTLEQHVTRFRHSMWWQHVSRHGNVNQLLTRFHDQHRLRERFDQIRSEITDFNNVARQDTSHQAQATVGLITVATIPATVALAALQVLGVKSPLHFALTIIVVLVVTFLIMLTRPVRTLFAGIQKRIYRLLDK